MNDIVERLRGVVVDGRPRMNVEAADEIERLRNECSNLTEVTLEAGKKIEQLRAALREICAWLPDEPIKAADIARHAREDK